MKATTFLLTLALGAAIFVTAPVPASAQVKKTGDAYLLRMKFKVGEKINYSMLMSGDLMPAGMNTSMSTVVKKVAGDTAEVQTSMTLPAGMPGGGKPTVTMIKVNSRGKMSGVGGSQMNQQLSNIELPEKPIKIGQTWTGTVSAGGGMTVNSTYKLVGTKVVSGQQCAQIGVTISSSTTMGKMSGTGTMYLRMSDCSMQSGDVNLVLNMPSQNGGTGKPMKFKQTITRK